MLFKYVIKTTFCLNFLRKFNSPVVGFILFDPIPVLCFVKDANVFDWFEEVVISLNNFMSLSRLRKARVIE